ncbi:ribosomal protein L23/L15e core domain-containing protein [Xylaria acuta]|nr:ribosomal protein L23/L15e core domain-containing protein [Xylaria acuta]
MQQIITTRKLHVYYSCSAIFSKIGVGSLAARSYLFIPVMADTVTVRTRKFQTNSLLSRRQMVVDVLHPGRSGVSRSHLEQALAMLYKATPEQISIFGLHTAFGGGKMTGFVCIYDTVRARITFDVKYRLKRAGLASRADRRSRQNRSHWKNWRKRFPGTKKPTYPALSVRWVTNVPL